MMTKEPKPTQEEYELWLEKKAGIRLDSRLQYYYITCQHEIKESLEKSPLWLEILRLLREENDQYFIKNDERLIESIDNIEIYPKPWTSLIDKTYRQNVLFNEDWPNPPHNEWITPHNCFTYITDVLRTTIVVKYLDGVEQMAQRLHTLCDTRNTKPSCDFEAKPEGYYAAHFCFHYDFPIRNLDSLGYSIKSVPIEIQITTQLKAVIKSLLWEFYRSRRSIPASEDKQWQWQWESNEFAVNYLGHILHYVDGMIVGIRKKQREKK
jgi:ppGpp synthetase/RelA/SpoT-type nucleotidyltranferase